MYWRLGDWDIITTLGYTYDYYINRLWVRIPASNILASTHVSVSSVVVSFQLLLSTRYEETTRCFNWKGKFFLLVLKCEVFSNIDWGNPEIHPQGRFSDQCLKIRIGYLIQVNELDILHLYILPILLSYRNGNWVHITLLRLLTHYYLEKK